MSEERLTDQLVTRVMGWRLAPDRYIISGRNWTPRWKFAPLTNLEHAFTLLDRAASAYTLTTNSGRGFEAEIRVGGRIGKAAGEPKARTIALALALALGLGLPDEERAPIPVPARRRRQNSRSKADGI
jgi:hypothetical protein